ncbi:MAG: T9SS type A sorting domain-containing protein [Saprospiraceae bacterium]|nr:T9SS type A sorting domain-containing protein [Saprospiraceae bacterium]
MKKSIFLSALFFFTIQFGYSQIESVDYSLRYNEKTCLFDCYLIVNQGKTKSTVSRAQFNSQVTIIVPVTSNVFIEESYMPLKDNQTFRSSEPVSWEISNELEQPQDLQNSRLVSVSPVLAPTAFYNELEEGDEVKLFSLKVNPIENCAEGVRLFDNNTDPSSIGKGMMGADFSNGFTIGGVEQKYHGNSLSELPSPPTFKNLPTPNKYGIDFEVNMLDEAKCQSAMSYTFFGPKGKIGDHNAFYSFATSQQARGEYKVIATDELGCSSEHKFYPFGKEESLETQKRDVDVEFESSIFPNPAQDIINLTVFGKKGSVVQADIFNLEGKKVRSSVAKIQLNSGEETVKIPTGLAPGVYNLSLTIDNTDVVNHKVIIIK